MASSEENARYAQQLLDNPMFNQAIADIKQEILAKWSASDSFDKEGREAAFVYYRALDMIHGKITGYVNKHIADVHRAEQIAAMDEYSIA